MSEVIQNETWFFLTSVATGVLLVFAYDLLRILRRVFKHGTILTGLEDFLYWCVTAFVIFCMIYEKNNGAIRGFAIAGILLGVILYHESVSGYIVKGVSTALNFIFHWVSTAFSFIFRPISKLKKILRKNLVKTLKSGKKAGKIRLRRKKWGKISKEGSYAQKKKR